MLPNLIVIGAAKCGTTSLHHYLSLHPEIKMSRRKELNFFIAECSWRKGIEWYQSNFTGQAKIYGVKRDILAMLFLLFSLIKPGLTLPFFWVLIFVETLRPVFLVGLGYIVLTCVALWRQKEGPLVLIYQWFGHSFQTAGYVGVKHIMRQEFVDLHWLLARVGLGHWALEVSSVVFFILGYWVWKHHKIDHWLLLGVWDILECCGRGI